MLLRGCMALRDKRLWLWVMLVVLAARSTGVRVGRAARFYHPLYVVVPVMMVVPFLARQLLSWVLPLSRCGASVGTSKSSGHWCVDDHLVDTLADSGITEGVVFKRPRASQRLASAWGLPVRPDAGQGTVESSGSGDHDRRASDQTRSSGPGQHRCLHGGSPPGCAGGCCPVLLMTVGRFAHCSAPR